MYHTIAKNISVCKTSSGTINITLHVSSNKAKGKTYSWHSQPTATCTVSLIEIDLVNAECHPIIETLADINFEEFLLQKSLRLWSSELSWLFGYEGCWYIPLFLVYRDLLDFSKIRVSNHISDTTYIQTPISQEWKELWSPFLYHVVALVKCWSHTKSKATVLNQVGGRDKNVTLSDCCNNLTFVPNFRWLLLSHLKRYLGCQMWNII